MAGDMRLPERFRSPDLVSLGSRVQTRLLIEPYEKTVLLDYLSHALDQAGAPHLMTRELKQSLTDHAAGNLRMLNSMAAELLVTAAQKDLPHLDEKLFLEVFSKQPMRK
jgi:type II secretory pathway predicted ATPase ExeA